MSRAAEWPSLTNVFHDEEIPDMIRVDLGGVGQPSRVQSNCICPMIPGRKVTTMHFSTFGSRRNAISGQERVEKKVKHSQTLFLDQ